MTKREIPEKGPEPNPLTPKLALEMEEGRFSVTKVGTKYKLHKEGNEDLTLDDIWDLS